MGLLARGRGHPQQGNAEQPLSAQRQCAAPLLPLHAHGAHRLGRGPSQVVVPMFVFFNLLFGWVLGRLLLFGVHVPKPQQGVVLAVTAIGNCGILPLALVSAACAPAVREKFGDFEEEECI
eukprot:CAMPEP_0169479638 /NCGR_PEP_ID=MMETSP1042-20121227/29128_1 /TAXON_ID=464988 /ORGANISM="Hemiselmis andersenii, Strain CCMP1180" /LENGTH=120 /DNA_ID=CAMNT_0009594211 /DNA_START=406 /DNA_END=765 /DNA_ORIENTATION=+